MSVQPEITYDPEGELKSGKSAATAMNVLGILGFGTYPTFAVWAHLRAGKPLTIFPGLNAAN